MNPGDIMQDASRTGPDEAGRLGTAVGQGTSARSLRNQGPVQDIQDIIDKLAAVDQQLRRPKSSAASRSN